jgi:hypothetical protein
MTYRLFIDDEREPPEDGHLWVVVRTSREACKTVEERGIPYYISFDHDLGGDDTAMVFVHWLIDFCLDHDLSLQPMGFYVHSQNPTGARNIASLIGNFQEKGPCPKLSTANGECLPSSKAK